MTRLLAGLVACCAALVVASPSVGAPDGGAQARISIFARPTVIGWAESALLYGTARGAGAQDIVRVDVKECGSARFRPFVEAHALAGGGWSTPVGVGVTATYRAVWRGRASAAVTIRQRANVVLERRRSGSGFVVSVSGMRSLWRKQVLVQRRQSGGWRTIRRVVLTDSVSSSGRVSVSQANLRLSVAKGTPLRALLPGNQAAPCYVESVSRTVRA